MLYGILLAGGLSKRYGSCKTKLELDKQSILAKTHALLSSLTYKTYVSCREENKVEGYPCLFDKILGYAPICGITTALSVLKAPVLVLSCDLPFVDIALLEELIVERNKTVTEKNNLCITTFQNAETFFIESLVAIYEYQALPLLEQGIANKEYALHKVLPPKVRHTIPFTNSRPFFNINYPEDLILAEQLFKKKGELGNIL